MEGEWYPGRASTTSRVWSVASSDEVYRPRISASSAADYYHGQRPGSSMDPGAALVITAKNDPFMPHSFSQPCDRVKILAST